MFNQLGHLHMQIRSLVITIKKSHDQITVQQLKMSESAGFQSEYSIIGQVITLWIG